MEMADRFDEITLKALSATQGPSYSIAATIDGTPAYAKAFGEATPESVYNIASVSKQFTAACVLLLARSGRLSLDDTVARWFPELTRADDVTIRHLLSHTSGYYDYYPLGFADEEKLHDVGPEEIVRRYATLPLQFEPGSAWSYSNTGYHVAGLIAERAAEMPFGAFLEQRVLEPAGLSASFFNDPPRKCASHVDGYTRYCLGPLRRSEGERAGWMYSSGGIASTASDLARWHTVLMNGTVLTPAEVRTMTTAVDVDPNGPSAPALGWFREDRGGHAVVQHSGGLAGFASHTVLSVEERRSIVVLTNGDHAQAGAVANRLFEELLPGAKAPAPVLRGDGARAAHSARYRIEQIVNGTLEPRDLTKEFAWYLTPGRLSDASEGLRSQGPIERATAIASGERGGMEWARVRVKFSGAESDVVLRETAEGRLAEFNVYPNP
jgi:D-alanyl-D-alanine carboxypeptidase